MVHSVSTLTASMTQLLGDSDSAEPERYVEAAEALLAPLLGTEAALARAHAIDLLVADALVTAAFEKVGDDPARVDACAAWAMRRLAALGVS